MEDISYSTHMMLEVIMTSNGDTHESSKKTKFPEDGDAPQKSILDFFKSPQKSLITSKPKDLLGYFKGGGQKSTTKQADKNTEVKTQEKKENIQALTNETKKKERKKTNRKRKRSGSPEPSKAAADSEKELPKESETKEVKGHKKPKVTKNSDQSETKAKEVKVSHSNAESEDTNENEVILESTNQESGDKEVCHEKSSTQSESGCGDTEFKEREHCGLELDNNGDDKNSVTSSVLVESKDDGSSLMISETMSAAGDEKTGNSTKTDDDIIITDSAVSENREITWKKTLDMDKIKTPNSKENRKNDEKKRKKKKKDKTNKAPSGAGENCIKALNLSDICNNFADVSILSDDGKSMVVGNEAKDSTVDRLPDKECDSEDSVKREVNRSKEETESDENHTEAVTEMSYSDFLLSTAAETDNGADEKETGNEKSQTNPSISIEVQKQKDNVPNEIQENRDDAQKLGKREKPQQTDPVPQGGNVPDKKTKGTKRKGGKSLLSVLSGASVNRDDVKPKDNGDVGENTTDKEHHGKPVKEDKVKKEICDAEDIPMPKQYPSITNFFSKVDKTKPRTQVDKKEVKKVTTKALIHCEPPQKSPVSEVGKHQRKSNSPSSLKVIDDEIQILGTEIITVDSPKPSGKKGEPVHKDDSEDVLEVQKEEQKACSETKKEPTRKSLTGKFEAISKVESRVGELKDVAVDEDGNDANPEDDDGLTLIRSTHNSDSSLITPKTKQATLSFGMTGLQMKSNHTTRVRKPNKTSKTAESQKLTEKSLKSSKRGTKKGAVRKEKGGVSKPNDGDGKDNGRSERRKSLRLKYRVDLLGDTYKKGSPIRIKLTRCSASSSSQDDSFTPGSKTQKMKHKVKGKQAQAQKILEKAKKNKKESKTKGKRGKFCSERKIDMPSKGGKSKIKSPAGNDEGEVSGRRRSSRHKSSEPVYIIDDNDDSMQGSSTPSKGKGQKSKATKATPNKGHKATPRKDVKSSKALAPIFMKKSKETETSSPAKRVILDPAAEKLRRAFLMSGVPEELHRQTVTTAPVISAEYPPIPSVNHVQQIEDKGSTGLNVWQLPSVSLKLKSNSDAASCPMYTKESVKTFIGGSEEHTDLDLIKKFTQHKKIEEGPVTEQLLKEIKQTCANYPVHKVYMSLKEKKEDDILDMANATDSKKTSEETSAHAKEKKGEKGIKEEYKPRRSLRRQRKEVIEVMDLGSSPESVNDKEDKSSSAKDSCPPTLSLLEKYQPLQSSDIVGNQAVVKRLKSWLVDWKHMLNREARKARMLLMKNSKSKTVQEKDDNSWWDGDSSDFDSEDSDDEDVNRLCNTVMLTGPVGIGKTSTVYALAQELGFKVFEVNASSCRNGKRILTQLQEATQSHQVSKNATDGSGTPSKSGQSQKTQVKKMPTAFTNLFKKAKAGDSKSHSDRESQRNAEKKQTGNKKRKREKDDDSGHTSKKTRSDETKKNKQCSFAAESEIGESNCLNLSSTSLILFDDVDLVFEQDKGFWAAVQSFMSTTKIPIVLTSNDTKLSTKFDGRFEHYSFKIPSIVISTVYLQLLCLVENVRTSADDVANLLRLNNGDIRKSLLSLQYWLLSGGGTTQVTLPLKQTSDTPVTIPNALLLDENSCSQDMSIGNSQSVVSKTLFCDNDEDDDFVTIKPVTSRHRQIISEDESSNSCMMSAVVPSNVTELGNHVTCQSSSEDQLPVVHMSSVSSSHGGVMLGCNSLIEVLKLMSESNADDLVSMAIKACQQYVAMKSDILYTHHLDLLPLPKDNTANTTYLERNLSTAPVMKKIKRRRIKFSSDPYDSEASNDSGITHDPSEPTSVQSDMATRESEDSHTCIKSLSSFCKFYDTLSFTDSLRTLQDRSDINSMSLARDNHAGSLSTGLSDQATCFNHPDWSVLSKCDTLCSEIEFRSYRNLYRSQKDLLSVLEPQSVDQFSVPVMKSRASSLVEGIATSTLSSKSSVRRTNNDIYNCLPLSVHGQKPTVTMDYLPTMREIVRTEQLRKTAKAKRRFHHYFDNIGLPLKETTLDVLSSTFK